MPATGSDKRARQAKWVINRAEKVVLFTDIVESVRLIESDEEGTIKRWLDLVEHVKSRIVADTDGRLVKNTGDGMLLEFGQVRDAVAAAFAIQHAVKRENADRPAEEKIFLRMGIDANDVIVENDEIYGRGVNLAARLMTLAGPDEIVISAAARDRLTPDLDADIEDLGDCYLRHYSEPVRAYRIGPPGPHPVIRSGYSLEQLVPTIAVIPFLGINPDPDQLVLGEVLAEEIIAALSLNTDLAVISRLSTTVFRGRDADHDRINAHLNADYVVSGVYRCAGDEITLDIKLAGVKPGQVLWSNRFQERLSDFLRGDQQMIYELVVEIGRTVVSRELQLTRSQPLQTLKSYTLLLSAIALMHRLSLRDFEQARQLIQTVIDRGSRRAVPQAWLANWHVLKVQQGWSDNQLQDAQMALECANRALDADPDCSLALAISGFVHTNLLRKLDDAQDLYNRAIETNPNCALAWLLKGTLHAFKGEGQQAVVDTQRALKLSPLDPHRYFYDSLASSACFTAGEYERARDLAQRSLRANRTHTSTLRVLAAAHWKLQQHDQARETAQELLRLEPNLTVSGWLRRSPGAEFRIGQEFADVLRKVGVPE